MQHQHFLPLTTILLLGAFHGINPGMGWLFAVALGMQERRPAAVWRALIPLTLGHALAIAAAVLVGVAAGAAIPAALLETSGRGDTRRVGRLQAGAAQPFHWRRDASRNAWTNRLVVSNGYLSWRRPDGSPCISWHGCAGNRRKLSRHGRSLGQCRGGRDGNSGAWRGVPPRNRGDGLACI